MPFENDFIRNLHFNKHKNEFTFADEFEYEAAADSLMQNPKREHMKECARPNGDRVRFNTASNQIAAVAPSGFLKTFHRVADKFKNQVYFRFECTRNL